MSTVPIIVPICILVVAVAAGMLLDALVRADLDWRSAEFVTGLFLGAAVVIVCSVML